MGRGLLKNVESWGGGEGATTAKKSLPLSESPNSYRRDRPPERPNRFSVKELPRAEDCLVVPVIARRQLLCFFVGSIIVDFVLRCVRAGMKDGEQEAKRDGLENLHLEGMAVISISIRSQG